MHVYQYKDSINEMKKVHKMCTNAKLMIHYQMCCKAPPQNI